MKELFELFQVVVERYLFVKNTGHTIYDALADVVEERGYVLMYEEQYMKLAQESGAIPHQLCGVRYGYGAMGEMVEER